MTELQNYLLTEQIKATVLAQYDDKLNIFISICPHSNFCEMGVYKIVSNNYDDNETLLIIRESTLQDLYEAVKSIYLNMLDN